MSGCIYPHRQCPWNQTVLGCTHPQKPCQSGPHWRNRKGEPGGIIGRLPRG